MNKQSLRVLSKMAFIISALYTAKLMLSNVIGFTNSILTIGTVIILEYGKMFFATKSIDSDLRKHKFLAYANITTAILLFSISILASQSFLTNQNNIIKNKQIVGSKQYQMSTDTYNNSKNDIAKIKAEIEQIKANKQNRINASIETLESERQNAIARNWITTPQGSPRRGKDVIEADIRTQITKTEQKINNEIKALETKLLVAQNVQESAKTELDDVNNISFNFTKGYISFLQMASEKLSTEDSQISVQQLEFILFLGIAILFEIVAVLMYYYAQQDKIITPGPGSKKKDQVKKEGPTPTLDLPTLKKNKILRKLDLKNLHF